MRVGKASHAGVSWARRARRSGGTWDTPLQVIEGIQRALTTPLPPPIDTLLPGGGIAGAPEPLPAHPLFATALCGAALSRTVLGPHSDEGAVPRTTWRLHRLGGEETGDEGKGKRALWGLAILASLHSSQPPASAESHVFSVVCQTECKVVAL